MSPDSLKVLVVSEFPYPIAHSFRHSLEDRESRESSCSLFQSAVEYLAQILIADFLSGDTRDPEINEDLRKLLQKPPSLGMWLDWLQQILSTFAKESRPPFLNALQVLLERPIRRDMDRLLEWRNRWVHSDAQPPLRSFRIRMFNILSRLQVVHRSTLFWPRAGRMSGPLHTFNATVLKGDNPTFGEVQCRSNTPLEAERVYLYSSDSRELISLHPFVVYMLCDQCGEHHYFHFNRPQGRRILYTSIPRGHDKSSGESYLLLEQMLRYSKPHRIRPRHFSLPGEFAGLPRTLQAGDSVGPYVVDELIRIGGMAQIYRVTSTSTGKSHALKLLPLELSRDPIFLMRFEEEAQNIKRLDHPNVVSLHDYGEDFGDRYIVLDLAIGGAVGRQKCRDLSEVHKPLPEGDIIALGKQICEGLHHVHSHGIVHRDLKPANLLIAGDRVLITDFGISRARGDSRITLTGLPVGTPEYMAPEQIQQEEIDKRADIYSLGCILYELATGRPPYRADTPLTTALYHLQATPPRIEDLNPRISAGLANIVYRAIQKKRDLRYQNAKELFEHLATATDNPAGPQLIEGDKPPQDAREEVAAQRRRFRRRLVAEVLSVLLVIALGIGVHVYITRRPGGIADGMVREAREKWLEGKSHWPEACRLIRDAFLTAPAHRGTEDLLKEILLQGSLRVRLPPEVSRIAVRPDLDATADLGLELHPRVLLEKTEDLDPGEPVPLTPGHYRIAFVHRGAAYDLPVFMGQIRYQYNPEKWQRQRLLPAEVQAWNPYQEENRDSITLADKVLLDLTRLPDAIPAGYCYINAGPYFRTELTVEPSGRILGDRESETRSDDKIDIFGPDRLVPDTLERGFLMARDETTFGRFKVWFERFGEIYRRWKPETEPIIGRLERRANLKGVKAATRDVPFPIQREYWQRELDVSGISDSDELLDAVFRKHREYWQGLWDGSVASMREEVLAGDERAPVSNVHRDVAIAYARTHAPVLAGEFRSWLEAEIAGAETLVRRLVELRQRLQGAAGDFVDFGSIPRDLVLGHRRGTSTRFSPRSLLSSYEEWFYYSAFYACQVPVHRVLRAAKAHGADFAQYVVPGLEPGLPSEEISRAVTGRLREIETALEKPHQWLWEETAPKERIYRFVVDHYARKIGLREERPDRAHFCRWLQERIHGEAERKRALEGLRPAVEGLAADAEVERLPWEVRLEYGWARGWNLPTRAQWEKAFRGPDTRRYPWGNVVDLRYAVLGGTGFVSGAAEGVEKVAVSNDQSPHGVYGLAGNVSEWVIEATFRKEHLLKGGNFLHNGIYADGGYCIGVTPGDRWRWAGFRVIRELRPTGELPTNEEGGGR